MKAQRWHWAAFNEFSFVAGMRFLFWLYRLCGRWPFRVALYPVLFWYLLTQGAARRASLAYLRRVSGFIAIRSDMLGALAHFAAFAESILDKMLLWGGLYRFDKVDYFGVERMNQEIRNKRGAVLVCSHLGNLELCRVLAQQHSDLRLTVLVHTKHAPAFNRMLAALNPASQLHLMQVTEMTPATAMLLSAKVETGEFVVIAGDRVPVASNPRTATANFLGAQAAFPVGPYILAGVLQCPIFMLFSMRRGARQEIHFELLREQVSLPRKGRDEVLSALVADYAARLEYHSLRAPLQWFNFYDFWHAESVTG